MVKPYQKTIYNIPYYVSKTSNYGTVRVQPAVEEDFAAQDLSEFLKEQHLCLKEGHQSNVQHLFSLNKLNPFWLTKKMVWGYSADEELLLKYADRKGIHYLIIGSDEGDIQYNMVPNLPEDFRAGIHADNVGLESVLDSFLKGNL